MTAMSIERTVPSTSSARRVRIELRPAARAPVRRGGPSRSSSPSYGSVRTVGGLVLVHVEVAPAILVAGEGFGRGVEQADGREEEVVEVEGACSPETLLVAGRESGDRDASARDRDEVVDLRRVDHLVLGPADAPEDRRRPRRALGLHALLGQDLLHERLLVVRVVDDEVATDPDGIAVAAQDTGA